MTELASGGCPKIHILLLFDRILRDAGAWADRGNPLFSKEAMRLLRPEPSEFAMT